MHEQLTKDRIDERSLPAQLYLPSHEQCLGIGPKYPSSAMTYQVLDATFDPVQRHSRRFKQLLVRRKATPDLEITT
ncbi:hypothetical protein [Promicromonospora sp. NPDC090134]|uniref:hypothetical protein n=1 Tax=Promicromonospora sp. NPDC090134 TaxID=3364408 RepID=UPI003818D619